MKLIISMLMVLTSASICFAVNTTSGYVACDGAGFTLGGGTFNGATAPTMILKSSKSVKLNYVGETTGTGYIIAGSHSSGTQSFATSSGDTKIFKSTASMDTTLPTTPTGSATAAWGTNWTSQ